MLYIMILDEVFKNSNSRHLLVYIMSDKKNKAIEMIDQEAKGLIQGRNILCRYKKNIRMGNFELPPMLLNDDRTCSYCFSKDLCCTLAVSFNKYCSNNEKPVFSHFKNIDRTLDDNVKEYFKTWVEKINKEQIESDKKSLREAKKHRKETIIDIEECKEPSDDEKELMELKKKIVVESNLKMTKVSPTVTGFIVSLERPIDKKLYEKIDEIEGSEHQIKELDEQAYVFLKPNLTSVVFTRGIITKKNYWITVENKRTRKSDLPDLKEFDSAFLEYIIEFNNQAYYNILSDALGENNWNDLKWEIQKEPFSNYSFSVMRNSIFQLCNDPNLLFLRNIIIGKSKPQKDLMFNKKKFTEKHSTILEKLSEEQQNAVISSMRASDFHIIEGSSLTGKSTVIIALLEILRKTNLKVLVVSSKNDVLDKLLVKANEQNISFVRISNSSSQVDPQILERIKTISSFKDYDELDRMIEDENIYAATCLGCQHGILGLLNPFDICIIEDAHCITESVALCSLILCKKFIMVGKPKEPKMSSDESIEHPENSNENLFRRLSRMHKDEISQLSCAYIE